MNHSKNIFFVGPMGAGKSTIGRMLAKRLKWKFYDSDHEIERRTGVNIPLVFDIEGEQGFRKRENKIIDELTSHSGIILATGGGAVLNPKNREYLTERGFVIYLKSGIDQLLKRTAKDQKRPLLQTDDPAAKLQEILSEREPFYREVANLIIETDKHTVKSIVDDIFKQQKFT
ncbi:MAG: shikimate kinase AroK [Gammaproteobacteria bacterium]